MIDPGEMRTKLVYQTNTPTTSSIGQPVKAWSDVFPLWAKVEPLSGREAWYANQIHASTSHKVTMRYHPGVVPSGRFRFANDPARVLNIDGVQDVDEAHVYMTVSCTEARD